MGGGRRGKGEGGFIGVFSFFRGFKLFLRCF